MVLEKNLEFLHLDLFRPNCWKKWLATFLIKKLLSLITKTLKLESCKIGIFIKGLVHGFGQVPITWCEQLSCPLVTVFLRNSLFLDWFWREF